MTQHDMTCAIALSRACCYGIPGAAALYRKAGSAGAVMALGSAVRDIMPDASDRLAALPTEAPAQAYQRIEACDIAAAFAAFVPGKTDRQKRRQIGFLVA